MKDHYLVLLSQDLCRLVNVSASLAFVYIVCTEITTHYHHSVLSEKTKLMASV